MAVPAPFEALFRAEYARAVRIAYRVLGDGPLDLVFVAGAITNLDVLWEMSEYRRACERLASFSRLILFDKRGMGLSDRVRVGTLEERMDDVRAILDAVGSETTALMGVSEGGPLSMLFAAAHPERTRALVLCGAEVARRGRRRGRTIGPGASRRGRSSSWHSTWTGWSTAGGRASRPSTSSRTDGATRRFAALI